MKYLPDFICLAGLGLLGYGLWLFEPWIAYSVCGSLLILFGILLGKNK